MPIVEESFSPQHVDYDPLETQYTLHRVGYFSTSKAAPVLQLRVDWTPDEESYWETAISVVLGNPEIFTRKTLLLNVSFACPSSSSCASEPDCTPFRHQPDSDEEFTTQGQWVHDNLPCRLDRQKLWRYTFYSKHTERRYTRAITKQMWEQRDSQDWVVYVGVVARAWRFGDGEHEIGKTDISGTITIAVSRRIDEQLVKLEVCRF
jgi:hypothetical protein